jgi:16S rRNA (guanine527-N7)-methyltransferase
MTTAANWPELGKDAGTRLRDGIAALGLQLTAGQFAQLRDYLGLLNKWNQTYNLTAVRDPAEMVTRHLLDSLVIAPYITPGRYIDVGTGAGLPGVPLAILYPGYEFHLLDSNGKKTRFLFQVKTALGLANMTVHHARVESFWPEPLFDGVLSRAFASLEEMARSCRHLIHPRGRLLAMKGVRPDEELAAVAGVCRLLGCHSLTVPGLDEQRHLVELAPIDDRH